MLLSPACQSQTQTIQTEKLISKLSFGFVVLNVPRLGREVSRTVVALLVIAAEGVEDAPIPSVPSPSLAKISLNLF